MPDTSDILLNPDATLERAIALDADGHDMAACQEYAALHRHMLAGGRPPRQWTGEGTAVGRMIAELQGNAYAFHINSCSSACNVAETDWGALKTDAEVALRAVTGEG